MINLPIGVFALACAVRLVPQIRGEQGERLDWSGFAMTTVCLVAIVVGCAALGAPVSDRSIVRVIRDSGFSAPIGIC